MLHNNKFKDLVENVFINIKTVEISKQIKELLQTSSVINNQSKRTGKFNDCRLFKEFCNGKNLKEVKRSQFSIEKPNKQFFEIKVPEPQKLKQSTLRSSPQKKTEAKPISVTSILKSSAHEEDFIENISKSSSKLFIQRLVKSDDYFSKAIFSYLSNIFNVAPAHVKDEMLKNIKLDIITKFNKEDFYKNYDYSIKYFKKSDADNVFTTNLHVSHKMLKIYGDIFNVNLVLRKDKFTNFITKFNPKNATIVIQENIKDVELLMSKDRFIRGDLIQDKLGVNSKFNEIELSKHKLDILQNYAKMKNINIRKAGKTGKINVKKEELITLICNN